MATRASEHTERFDIGPARDRAECERFAEIVIEALSFPPLSKLDWLVRYDPADIWLAREDGRAIAGAVLIRAGQWFGGRAVPMTGIHAVGVVPEARGRGVAGALMTALIHHMRADGAALSCLYPATQPVYRRVGYELAGVRTWYKLQTASIDARDRSLPVERVPAPDEPGHHAVFEEMAACYREFARAQSGLLDRSPFLWGRMLTSPAKPATAFAVRQDGRMTGYVLFRQEEPGAGFRYALACRDLVALTPEAARRLLALLADHRSMATAMYLSGPPSLSMLLPVAEADVAPDWHLRWMLRVLDVPAALAARGYPPGLSARIRLAVHDELVPENSDIFELTVADGRGSVVRVTNSPDGGLGAVASVDLWLDVRGLASLYTGFATASELVWTGLATGMPIPIRKFKPPDPDALARVSAVFAGPAPWMIEIY